jgi:hypothetical protein
MKATKKRERWLIVYFTLALGVPEPVVSALFPTPEWGVWSEFFKAEVARLFSKWRRDTDAIPGMMGFRRRTMIVQQLGLYMEAVENISIGMPLPQRDYEWFIWHLYWCKGNLWISHPTGKRFRILRMGTARRIKRAAREIHNWARYAALKP